MTVDKNDNFSFSSQDEVDKWYEEAKSSWNEEVKKSGKRESIFIASSSEARQVLYAFSIIKQDITKCGFTCPDLAEGVQVLDRTQEPSNP